MIRSIVVATIPHSEQRYDTCGDWTMRGQCLNIAVSDLGDWRMNACVAVHEIVEALQCARDGVKEADVSAFDIAYEEARQNRTAAPCGCVPTDTSEPGEDEHAPYALQHANADLVERILARALGLNWSTYSEKVEAL